MSRRSQSAELDSPFIFSFYSIRNITSPEDKDNDRKVYVGQAPLSAILDLNTDANVREYLIESRKKRVYSQVHRAIRDTLERKPEDFSVLNSGITIVARDCEIQEDGRVILTKPSIINGAQTQGIINDFFSDRRRQPLLIQEGKEPHIKFELIITSDEDLIANISIARNFQNDVMTISIVGARGQLDELNRSFKQTFPDLELRTSETEVPYEDNSYVETERLIQVIAALVPEELWVKSGEFNKVYTYSQKTRCLKDFQDIYKIAKDQSHPLHTKHIELYQFYLDVAGQAYSLYTKWKTHAGFRGTGLRSIQRTERGEIEDVPDGIIFPILAALSVFAEKREGKWQLSIPQIDNELISAAKSSYQEVAKSQPNVMGKSKACYASLSQITSIIHRYAKTSSN
jgi:hypothetical protein